MSFITSVPFLEQVQTQTPLKKYFSGIKLSPKKLNIYKKKEQKINSGINRLSN